MNLVYNEVELTMEDELTGETVKRSIDISNIYNQNGGGLLSAMRQKEALEQWIEDRGNPQHETILKLIDWKCK